MSTSFERVHAADVTGKLEMFDRMIFHGHLSGLCRQGAFEVGTQANARYLEALAQVPSRREAVGALDGLCRSATREGRHVARLNPATNATCALFAAALAGEHTITGFRNHDLNARLYPRPPASAAEAKRRCAHVSRLIAKLRGHRLIAKVRASRLYRPTPYGIRVMAAALARHVAFPEGFRLAS